MTIKNAEDIFPIFFRLKKIHTGMTLNTQTLQNGTVSLKKRGISVRANPTAKVVAAVI